LAENVALENILNLKPRVQEFDGIEEEIVSIFNYFKLQFNQLSVINFIR